jgi:Trypsin-like peptidase domain
VGWHDEKALKMKNLQELTDRVLELKGSQIAFDVLLPALLEALPSTALGAFMQTFESRAQAIRAAMLQVPMSEHLVAAFDHEMTSTRAMLSGLVPAAATSVPRSTVEAVLLATTRICTYVGKRSLTGASGFFFRREGRLFLVTNRHVFVDQPSLHFPDRVEIELHTDAVNLTRIVTVSIPLYDKGMSLWREALDTAGTVDVAVIELKQQPLPSLAVFHAFDATHLDAQGDEVAVGDALTIIGFPLGFHDAVHHLGVARIASLASAYGVRFQQQGYFLTDARMHRGSSGAPVLRRRSGLRCDGGTLPWQLLGVHSSRMDMRTRDVTEDEALGLNCAWYADVLMTLTAS